MSRKATRLFVTLTAAVMAVGLFGNGKPVAAQAKVKVGLSFSDFATERWPQENKLMTQLLQDKGYDVVSQQANQDPKTQNDQIENMITQGVKAIIVVAQDGDAAATAASDAAKA